MSTSYTLVSVHGGHSGEFCSHAKNTLAEIVAAYAEQGFAWVGLSEHMPPQLDSQTLPEEAALGYTATDCQARFAQYMQTARALQRQWAGRLTIWVGMETEAWHGYIPFVQQLRQTYQPDYLVGSVHHLFEIMIDGSAHDYAHAVTRAGGIVALYCDYFDKQAEMIAALQPQVVAHFDLIRMHDPDYHSRWQEPAIWERVQRNLDLVREHGLILDYNTRALLKGASEPYLSHPILQAAIARGIAVVPGDDSHGVANLGCAYNIAIPQLATMGGNLVWQSPVAHSIT